MDEETQRLLFAQATAMLGGSRATGRLLDISERTIMRYMSGESQPNSGVLTDLCRELIQRADACRDVEARLNPLFEKNRAPGQLERQNRGRPRIERTEV